MKWIHKRSIVVWSLDEDVGSICADAVKLIRASGSHAYVDRPVYDAPLTSAVLDMLRANDDFNESVEEMCEREIFDGSQE